MARNVCICTRGHQMKLYGPDRPPLIIAMPDDGGQLRTSHALFIANMYENNRIMLCRIECAYRRANNSSLCGGFYAGCEISAFAHIYQSHDKIEIIVADILYIVNTHTS